MTAPALPASAARLDRRQVLLGSAFAATAVAAWSMTPSQRFDLLGQRKLEKVVPETLGRWRFYSKSGLVVPPQDQLSQELYSQLLTRVYTAPGEAPVMLLIAQSAGQTGILQIHRPDVCYPAGGFQLSPKEFHSVTLPDRTLNTVGFTAVSDARTEQLLFWTRVGRDMPMSWTQQRISVARANLQGSIPDAVLVRVSTLSADKPGSIALLDDFVTSFFSSLSPDVRQVFDYRG